MAILTFAQGKTYVASVTGATTADSDIDTRAADAIKAAIGEWNLRRDWRFLLMDNAAAPIAVVQGTSEYALASTVKRPHSARLLTNPKSLTYITPREIDRRFANQSTQQIPSYYTLYTPTGFDPATPIFNIKLFPEPATSESLLVRWYRLIATPSVDGDELDILELYQYALLELARYYFLRDDDAENPRTGETKERAEALFRQAYAHDNEDTDDREVTLISGREWASARVSSYPDTLFLDN